MTRVLFVHGTGVRARDSAATLKDIKEALAARRPDIEVGHCDWGDELGTKLFGGGLSIPDYHTTRGPDAGGAEVTADEYLAALWSALEDDPLFELRLLTQRASQGPELAPNQKPAGDRLRKQLGLLSSHAALGEDQARLRQSLEAAGLAAHYDQACIDILDDPVFTHAIRLAPQDLSEDRAAVARAVIAQALLLADGDDEPPAAAFDPDLRDEAAEALASALGPTPRSLVGDWIRAPFVAIAKRRATRYLRRKRGKVSDEIYGMPGDVLLYQTRGGPIRERIADRVNDARGAGEANVVLLAHSLGGIAAVDLLIERNPGVKLLITVGSQAPFLYEMNALPSLPFSSEIPPAGFPEHFPDWLNLYDLRDMLSYVARPLFGRKVQDMAVDNGKPFPNSHSGYWRNEQVWNAIVPRLP